LGGVLSMSVWRNVADGFAVGPERVISLGSRRVVVSSLWSDEDGVCVSVDAGDEPLPAGLAERVALGVIQLAALPAPRLMGAGLAAVAAFLGGDALDFSDLLDAVPDLTA